MWVCLAPVSMSMCVLVFVIIVTVRRFPLSLRTKNKLLSLEIFHRSKTLVSEMGGDELVLCPMMMRK